MWAEKAVHDRIVGREGNADRNEEKLQLNRATQITSCSKVIVEKLTGPQIVKKFPAFYGT